VQPISFSVLLKCVSLSLNKMYDIFPLHMLMSFRAFKINPFFPLFSRK
jgi:hypothetical protein